MTWVHDASSCLIVFPGEQSDLRLEYTARDFDTD